MVDGCVQTCFVDLVLTSFCALFPFFFFFLSLPCCLIASFFFLDACSQEFSRGQGEEIDGKMMSFIAFLGLLVNVALLG